MSATFLSSSDPTMGTSCCCSCFDSFLPFSLLISSCSALGGWGDVSARSGFKIYALIFWFFVFFPFQMRRKCDHLHLCLGTAPRASQSWHRKLLQKIIMKQHQWGIQDYVHQINCPRIWYHYHHNAVMYRYIETYSSQMNLPEPIEWTVWSLASPASSPMHWITLGLTIR